jgi:lysosomal-associated transmembrane protein
MGTVFLGIFNLIKDLLAVTVITAVTLHPELMQQPTTGVISSYLGFTGDSANVTSHNATSVSVLTNNTWDCDDRFLLLLLTIGSSMLTICLLYGTITARPKYILPYFWLQMFDFCITSLTVIGYFSYGPDIGRWIEAQKSFPYRDELLAMGREWLLVCASLLAVIILWTKAYCISVVWSCYKYLIYRQTSNAVAQAFSIETPPTIVDDETAAALERSLNETQMVLPPKYEDLEIITSPADISSSVAPPPAYETLLGNDAAVTRTNNI